MRAWESKGAFQAPFDSAARKTRVLAQGDRERRGVNIPGMARVRVPLYRVPRARACVVCGEVDGVQVETIMVRSTGWWFIVLASLGVCGALGPFIAWWMLGLEAARVRLPFTRRCYKTWARVRLASRLLIALAFLAPYLGVWASEWANAPDLVPKAFGTGLVLLIVPALLRFGPAVLGPVFGRMRGGMFAEPMTIDVILPNDEATAALERDGWD